MLGIVRSELLKMRHSFAAKLIIIAPLVTAMLAYVLSGSYFQYSAYNWWCTMILPMIVSLWPAASIAREKKTGMQNVVCLPIQLEMLWIGKALALVLLLAFIHLLMWVLITGLGFFVTVHISPANGLIGCSLLFVTSLWQIPFVMLLASRLGYWGSVLASFVGNMIFFSLGTEKIWFLFNPYAIPSRIICPFFKMRPNGIPIEGNSVLLDTGCVFPAVAISLAFATVVLWVGSKLFSRGGRHND